MNRTDFETELSAQGYREVVDRQMPAGHINSEHAHEFDARLMVLEGEMTVACDGEERTYRAGDTFAMSAGRRHAERSGPNGVRYLAGRRYHQAPAS
ncbi:MAG: cupin domain-containing protein [Alphaproteobacteria bacterium]|nr:cupin domain-containing protein [Alphaproteobacteria bacterium]MBV9687643.1 cupin domain-containing protein [Alphaproteobacteria bacterium]